LSGRYECIPRNQDREPWRQKRRIRASGAEGNPPESWLERLAMREFITEMADSLGSFSESQ
jgi:hypothetical protein